MSFYSLSLIQSWDRFYRANFINSLSGFKSASLIATADKQGVSNLAIFSNIVHLGADPALIGFVNRPVAAAPHTLANIEATGQYTINLITADQAAPAHHTSAKYPAGHSEFAAAGFTEEWTPHSMAPFVKESPVKYAMQLQKIISLEINQTFFVIGAVTGVWADDQLVGDDGFLSLEKADILTTLGIDAYYRTQRLDRFRYAKPGEKTASANQ